MPPNEPIQQGVRLVPHGKPGKGKDTRLLTFDPHQAKTLGVTEEGHSLSADNSHAGPSSAPLSQSTHANQLQASHRPGVSDQNALFAAKVQENAVRTSTAAYQRPPIEVTFSGRNRSPDVDEQWRKAVNDLFHHSAGNINAKAVQGEKCKRTKPSRLSDFVLR